MAMNSKVFRNPYCVAIYLYLVGNPQATKEAICEWYSINATVCSHSLVDLHYEGYVQIIRCNPSGNNRYVAFQTPQYFYPMRKGDF